jgi:hypothetical protein
MSNKILFEGSVADSLNNSVNQAQELNAESSSPFGLLTVT